MSILERARLAKEYAYRCEVLERARQAFLIIPETSSFLPLAQANYDEASALADQAFLALMRKVTEDAQR